jgi:ankyrin repeat protein
MGNECCSPRSISKKSYLDFPDGLLLKEAIACGDSESVMALASLTTDNAVLNSIMDQDNNSAFLLICSAFPTDPDLIEFLAIKGAQVRMRNYQGETAIHLLAKGGSLNDTSLLSIKYLHTKHKLRLYHRDVNDYDALWSAVKSGDLAAYRYLKSWGCDRHFVDSYGENVLFVAVRQGNLGLVKQMVDYDELDIGLVNVKGETLVDIARDHEEILTYLKATLATRLLQLQNSAGDEHA